MSDNNWGGGYDGERALRSAKKQDNRDRALGHKIREYLSAVAIMPDDLMAPQQHMNTKSAYAVLVVIGQALRDETRK